MGDWEREANKEESGRGEIVLLPPPVTLLLVLVNSVVFLGTFVGGDSEGVFVSYGLLTCFFMRIFFTLF